MNPDDRSFPLSDGSRDFTAETQPAPPEHSPQRRLGRPATRLIVIVIALALIVLGLEIFARYRLGLGDPPLMMSDPDIEYLYQPLKSYTRLGNHISFNQWSMRSDDFPKHKSDPRELRILMMGDSIINGGAHTDQSDLASEIIKRELQQQLNRPVVVGNISAGSWGPPNLLAYARRFGLFEADMVIVVLSSHDASDAPTFEPLGPDAPQRTPLLALQEAAQRYLPRYLPQWLGGAAPTTPRTQQQIEADREQSLRALRELIELARASQGAPRIALALHWQKDELLAGSTPPAGHDLLRDVAQRSSASVIDLAPAFRSAINSGQDPYRDNLHPNSRGQQALALTLLPWILQHASNDARDATNQRGADF